MNGGTPVLTLTGITLNSADFLFADCGGSAVSTAVNSGGQIAVAATGSGGTASGTTIDAGGFEDVESTGVDTGATLSGSNSVQELFDTGKAISATVYAGDADARPGCWALSRSVLSSAVAELWASKPAPRAMRPINEGATETVVGVAGFAQTSDDWCNDQRQPAGRSSRRHHHKRRREQRRDQEVTTGGTATGTTVNDGGRQTVGNTATPGGTVVGTVVESGGTLELIDDVTANDFTISSGGTLIIRDGYTLSGHVMSSGAMLLVSSGGTSVDTTIDDGGSDGDADGRRCRPAALRAGRF